MRAPLNPNPTPSTSGPSRPIPAPIRRLTVSDIARLHFDGERIAMLTAYDYPTARLLDEAGIPPSSAIRSVG